MKRFLALALCALFACQTEARTLYVDAKRPNNNGNGLKPETAKKTLQAAINAAKKGDTIVVYPGTYAPIATKDKEIKIKAKSGNAKTTIATTATTKWGTAIAKLGKEWKEKHTTYDDYGYPKSSTWKSGGETKGNKTSLTGFALDGGNRSIQAGVSGGTVASCIVKNVGPSTTVCRSKLTGCTIRYNANLQINGSTLDRCKVLNNRVLINLGPSEYVSESSQFSNCLFACNETPPFESCTFANCTVADNQTFAMSKSKAWNTVFHKVAASQFKKSEKNKLKNCYKGSNPKFVSTSSSEKWIPDENGAEQKITAVVHWYVEDYAEGDTIHQSATITGKNEAEINEQAFEYGMAGDDDYYYVDSYVYENGDYTDVPGNYHLKKGSPCINKGTKAKAANKLYGNKDLDGKKRVKGKSVDIGCYEY